MLIGIITASNIVSKKKLYKSKLLLLFIHFFRLQIITSCVTCLRTDIKQGVYTHCRVMRKILKQEYSDSTLNNFFNFLNTFPKIISTIKILGHLFCLRNLFGQNYTMSKFLIQNSSFLK